MSTSNTTEGYDTCIYYEDYDTELLTHLPASSRTFKDKETGKDTKYYIMPLKYAYAVGSKTVLDDGNIICPEMECPFGIVEEDFAGRDDKEGKKSKPKPKIVSRGTKKYQVGFTVNLGYKDQATFFEKCKQIFYAGGKLVQKNDVALGRGGFETPDFNASKKPEYTSFPYVKRDERNRVMEANPMLYAPLITSKIGATKFIGLDGKAIPWSDLIDTPFKGIPYIKPEDIYAGNGIKMRIKLVKVIVTQISSNQPSSKDMAVIERYRAANPDAASVQEERLRQIREAKMTASGGGNGGNGNSGNGGSSSNTTEDVLIQDKSLNESKKPKKRSDSEDEGDSSDTGEDSTKEDSDEEANNAVSAMSAMTVNPKSANNTYTKKDLKTVTNAENLSRTNSQKSTPTIRVSRRGEAR